MVKAVKVWRNPTKTETRIYVQMSDGREGCRYITGNPWHPRGEIEGDLTAGEWKAARRAAFWDGAWHNFPHPIRYNGPDEDVRNAIEDLQRLALDAEKRQGRGDMEEEYGHQI